MISTRQEPILITVPFTPPSVNHYKKPAIIRTRDGPRKTFILTPEALAFKNAIAIFARGQTLIPPTAEGKKNVRYALYVVIYQGLQMLRTGESKRRDEVGDGDNYWKCLADGLVDAGVIHTDKKVRRWHLDVEDCDRDNPRTEIRAELIERRFK